MTKYETIVSVSDIYRNFRKICICAMMKLTEKGRKRFNLSKNDYESREIVLNYWAW